MLRISTVLFLILLNLAAWSSVLDPLSRVSISKDVKSRSDEFLPLIIRFESGQSLKDLEARGAVIWRVRQDMALCCLPKSLLAELDSFEGVKTASIGEIASTNLDKARDFSNVALVQGGAAPLSQTFTGKGIIAGFVDTGFDPGHIAFAGRVCYLANVDGSNAVITRAFTPGQIAVWTTDTPSEYHATHVGGILAGNDPGSSFTGVATDADICAVTCSQLYDAAILAGVEEIIEYAKNQGKPAVINLSLGSRTGPHDGSDLFCQYLDLCAHDAAIVLSAGNDGHNDYHIRQEFSQEDQFLLFGLESANWGDTSLLQGYVDIWCSDSRPIRWRLKCYDRYKKSIYYESEWLTSDYAQIDAGQTPMATDFEGRIQSSGDLSENNGKFNHTIAVDLKSLRTYPDQGWSNSLIVIEIYGLPGQSTDIYLSGGLYPARAHANIDLKQGSTAGSISNLACGNQTIAVGSSNSRSSARRLDGQETVWSQFTQGEASYFSSYGPSADGRDFPHFCAPGAMIISAISRYYTQGQDPNQYYGESSAAAGHYYGAENGTSMASPHAAGIFALWLQADPSLTPRELCQIAVETVKPLSSDHPRNGAGEIDALEGLKKILANASIYNNVEPAPLDVRIVNRAVITVPENMPVEAFSLDGRPLNPNNLPAGPVIIIANGQSFKFYVM